MSSVTLCHFTIRDPHLAYKESFRFTRASLITRSLDLPHKTRQALNKWALVDDFPGLLFTQIHPQAHFGRVESQ